MATKKETPKKASQNRILNCLPSKEPEQDWTAATAAAAGILPAAPLPPEIDLRASWWTVGNQGETGSCVGWATADSVLRWHFVKAQWIAKTKGLSVRFVWMAAKETDVIADRPTTFIEVDGTTLKAALDIARKFGVVAEDVLPFGTGKLFPGDSKTFYALASQCRIASYFNLGTSPAEWRKWLALQGPILARLEVDSSWMAVGPSGKLDNYNSASVSGGHAVAIVGYTADRFIVRNSWGTTWGDKGFGYAPLPYVQAAFTEAYGVKL